MSNIATDYLTAQVRRPSLDEQRAKVLIQIRTLRSLRVPEAGLYFIDYQIAVSGRAFERIRQVALEDLEMRLANLDAKLAA